MYLVQRKRTEVMSGVPWYFNSTIPIPVLLEIGTYVGKEKIPVEGLPIASAGGRFDDPTQGHTLIDRCQLESVYPPCEPCD